MLTFLCNDRFQWLLVGFLLPEIFLDYFGYHYQLIFFFCHFIPTIFFEITNNKYLPREFSRRLAFRKIKFIFLITLISTLVQLKIQDNDKYDTNNNDDIDQHCIYYDVVDRKNTNYW